MRRISWTDQRIRLGGPRSSWRRFFGGGRAFAWCRITAIMAKASMTSETWRCQPCQDRVSLWSRPSSFLAVSKLSSIAQRWPSTWTRVTMSVPAGHQVEKKARSPSAMLRRISRPRVHSPVPARRIRRHRDRPVRVRPVMEPGAFGSFAGRQALPCGTVQSPRDLTAVPATGGLLPGAEVVFGLDAEHVALARPAQAPSRCRRRHRRYRPPPRRMALGRQSRARSSSGRAGAWWQRRSQSAHARLQVALDRPSRLFGRYNARSMNA